MKDRPMRFACHFLAALCLLAGVRSASAFALLGPFAPWMASELGYQDDVSIGGPMNIGEGYRWNVPVITYGYDQSFLDYFGTNGVAAVDNAIQMLNSLPPASQIVLTNYPLNSSRVNYAAQAQNLNDLKSYALCLLVEQMGLAQPTRYVYCLHDFTISNGVPVYTVLLRNFDPTTWEPSTNVNGVPYACQIQNSSGFAEAGGVFLNPDELSVAADAVADSVPSGYKDFNTFADNTMPPGRFFLGLTRDDVGGLAYLLSSNHVALENLIPGIQGTGTNASNFVNTALRPGVEKITFQRVDYISAGVFPVVTNQYVDSYYTNGVLQQQTLQRVTAQPDILFTAKFVGLQAASGTGTTNWVNNGGPGNEGPGVIQPPVVINFNQFGPSIYFASEDYATNSAQPMLNTWASYDGTTNAPIVYPQLAATNSTAFHFVLQQSTVNPNLPATSYFTWNLAGQPNGVFSLQVSTNLQDWNTITSVTNLGNTFTFFDRVWTNVPQRFFRTVPQ